MFAKIKTVLGSVSFWLSVIGAVILILGEQGIIPMDIAIIIAGWAGVSITKRTIDRAI